MGIDTAVVETEAIGTRTRIVELQTPLINELPLGDDLARMLQLEPRYRQQLSSNRSILNSQPNVFVLAHDFGIGDALLNLRQAQALASALPDKQFLIYLPKTLGQVQFTGLPQNAFIKIPGQFEPFTRLEDSFFMTCSPRNDASAYVTGAVYPETPQNRALMLNHIPHFLEHYSDDRGELLKKLYQAFPQFNNPLYNYADILKIVTGRLLGINVNPEKLNKPLFDFEQSGLPSTQFDMLIIPDAKEVQTQDATGIKRSIKALSIEQWKEIFSLLPPNLRYGLVKGVSYPDYCDAITAEARKTGKNFQFLSTPTLNDLVQTILKSNVVVSMDSGTTHLASEIAKGANLQGRNIDLRVVFNGDYFDVNEYGIGGLNRGQGKILVYKSISDREHLLDLNPDIITRFILSQ